MPLANSETLNVSGEISVFTYLLHYINNTLTEKQFNNTKNLSKWSGVPLHTQHKIDGKFFFSFYVIYLSGFYFFITCMSDEFTYWNLSYFDRLVWQNKKVQNNFASVWFDFALREKLVKQN